MCSFLVGLVALTLGACEHQPDFLAPSLNESIQKQQLGGVRYAIFHGAEVNAPDKRGMTPLMYAAHGPDPEMVTLLLSHGADVHARDPRGWTPLVYALGNTRNMALLVEAGAVVDVEIYPTTQVTPLVMAAGDAVGGGVDALQFLIEHGAEVNHQTAAGATSLLQAATGGYLTVVQALLTAKADPNLANEIGRTPLISATLSHHTPVVEALLQARADPNKRMLRDSKERDLKAGETALALAKRKGFRDVVTLLERAGGTE